MLAEDVTLRQGLTEAVDIVKLGHIYVSMADLAGSVGVAASALEQPMFCGESEGLGIRVSEAHGARVEDLDDVYLVEKPHYLVETSIIDASHVVEGMGETDKPVLSFDPSDRLVNRDVARDRLREEHPQDLSQRSQYFFGYNHSERGHLLDAQGALYRSVVSHSDAVDAGLLATLDDRFRRRGAVEGVLGVQVKVGLQHDLLPRESGIPRSEAGTR